MRRKITSATITQDLLKAALGRKTTQGRINKLIDAFVEDKPITDNALHFLNEAVLHGHPKQFKANTLKYVIKPYVRRKLLKARLR